MWNSLSNINFYDNLLDQRDHQGTKIINFDFDVNKLCRTCLREAPDVNNLGNDFEIGAMNINMDGKLLKMVDMLREASGLEIYDSDLLPHQLCNNCIQNVSGAYFFRLQSHKAEKTLLRLLDVLREEFLDDGEKKDLENQDRIQNNTLKQSTEVKEVQGNTCQLMEIEFDGIKYKIESDFQQNEDREDSEIVDCIEEDIQNLQELDYESEEHISGIVENIQIEFIDNHKERKCDENSKSNYVNICSECDEKFDKKKDLAQHIQTSHSQIKVYGCDVCNSRFSKVQTLKRHMKIHQADQKNKLCTFCGKCFTRADDLKRHIRIHTGERPYACSLCPKRYKQTSELKEHLVTHSKDKPYICTICGKSLQTRNGHYVHMKVHQGVKNHICRICDNRYVTSGELNSHMKHIHDKKKPFTCKIEQCRRSFTTKLSLEIHQRAHAGERPYVCLTCNKKLATASSLSEHLRVHFGEKRSTCAEFGIDSQHMTPHIQLPPIEKVHADTYNNKQY